MKIMLYLKRLLAITMLLISMLNVANNVYAASSDTASNLVCPLKKIIDLVQGPIGKGVGIIAVIFLAVGLFMGKVSWGVAIATALGIGVIFGASEIVGWLGGGDSANFFTGYTCT